MTTTSTVSNPSRAFDPKPAAELLLRTWRSHDVLEALPDPMRPATLAEGYAIQDEVARLRGEPVAGWKLGVGSIGAMRQGKLARPLIGRVFGPLVFAAGSVVPLPTRRPITIECEIAFVLGQDIAPGEAPARGADAVSSTRVTFEFVLSRFLNRRAVGWPSFVADGVGFGALVVGPEVDTDRIDEVAATLCVLADGVERARGATGDDVTSPWGSFAALLAHAAEQGIMLKKGQIITTGACAMPFDIPAAPVHLEARFAGQSLTAGIDTAV